MNIILGIFGFVVPIANCKMWTGYKMQVVGIQVHQWFEDKQDSKPYWCSKGYNMQGEKKQIFEVKGWSESLNLMFY